MLAAETACSASSHKPTACCKFAATEIISGTGRVVRAFSRLACSRCGGSANKLLLRRNPRSDRVHIRLNETGDEILVHEPRSPGIPFRP